jgi:hypothetical protein
MEMRQASRNAYAHADKAKTFGQAITPVAAVQFTGDRLVSEGKKQVPLADLPIFQGVFQVSYAEKDTVPDCLHIDSLAR